MLMKYLSYPEPTADGVTKPTPPGTNEPTKRQFISPVLLLLLLLLDKNAAYKYKWATAKTKQMMK